MATVYLSIGSNRQRDKNMASAIACLTEQFGKLILSNVYETPAVGLASPPFYNLVLSFTTALTVDELIDWLKQCEAAHGRVRGSTSVSLDLDLLLYDNLILQHETLQLPHPDICQYGFILQPLAEIAPQLIHPLFNKNYALLWDEFDKTKLNQHKVSLKGL